jgi:heat shock protein HtpX
MGFLKTTLLLGALTGILVLLGHLLFGRQGAILAFGVAAAMNVGSYWFSDKIVLARSRAREIRPEEQPRMHAVVDEIARKMGIPKPRVYLVPDAAPNAFATGRNPKHAAIAATAGLLELLDDRELEGVLAHELGHVRNRDILISTVAATVAGAIMVGATLARFGGAFSGSSRERGGNPLAMLVAVIFAPLAATVIQLMISRTREYAADETGARVSGDPLGLASALEKLGQASGRIPLASATPANSHLFIVRPRLPFSTGSMFATHPPLEERIRRLRAMSVPEQAR